MSCARIIDPLWSVLAVLLFAIPGWQVCAAGIGFTESSHTVRPGDSLALVVELSEPIPNGLEGYALKLVFVEGTFSVTTIEPVPELDFDLFEPGAIRAADATSASIAGYTEFGQPAYSGTAFVTFNVSIRADAPEGIYPLSLEPMLADGVNFVDGLGNAIDQDLTFGTASVEILPPWPSEYIDDLQISIQEGQAVIRFTGIPGRPYEILYSDSMQSGQWDSLGTFNAPENGLVEVTDPQSTGLPNRFYRVAAP